MLPILMPGNCRRTRIQEMQYVQTHARDEIAVPMRGEFNVNPTSPD